MTRSMAAKKMVDLDAEGIVTKIIEILSTENYGDAKTILEIAGVYISASALIDVEVAKQNMKENLSDDFD